MTGTGTRSLSRSWLWVPFAWLALAAIDASQTVVAMHSMGMHHNWPLLFFVWVLGWLPWIPATALILAIDRRFPLRSSRWIAPLCLHAMAGVLIALTLMAWQLLTNVAFNPTEQVPPSAFLSQWKSLLYLSLLSAPALYTMVLVAKNALRARDLSQRLAAAQLGALRHQIEPHFLFNSLNGIAGLIRDGRQDEAVQMIVALGDFLRRTLKGSQLQEVPLRDEVEFTRQYLAVQKMRFADRLCVEIDVPGDLESAPVPYLILQPLVENAVVHGIAKRTQAGLIRIAAARQNGTLILRVVNDGPALSASCDAGGGIGISNVRDRLLHLYGERSRLDVRDSGSGVEASISIPLRVR